MEFSSLQTLNNINRKYPGVNWSRVFSKTRNKVLFSHSLRNIVLIFVGTILVLELLNLFLDLGILLLVVPLPLLAVTVFLVVYRSRNWQLHIIEMYVDQKMDSLVAGQSFSRHKFLEGNIMADYYLTSKGIFSSKENSGEGPVECFEYPYYNVDINKDYFLLMTPQRKIFALLDDATGTKPMPRYQYWLTLLIGALGIVFLIFYIWRVSALLLILFIDRF
jgi:hypothetical protein